MLKNYQYIILIFLLLFTNFLFSQSITTMNFLTYASDPIATGRGVSGTAADDNSSFLNPANLYSSQKYQGFIFRRTFPNAFNDKNYLALGAAYKKDDKHVLY